VHELSSMYLASRSRRIGASQRSRVLESGEIVACRDIEMLTKLLEAAVTARSVDELLDTLQ
jgi:hypothetical protein